MNRPNHAVVESNIPAAQGRISFNDGTNNKQRRELADLTAWMEEQEEAELALLLSEMTATQHRAQRRSMSY